MERSIFTALLGGLLGLTTLGGFALSHSSPAEREPGPNPGVQAEGEWRLLEPVTYDNISIFPVVSPYSADTSSFLTLEEGLASGEVTIRE